MSKHLCLSCRHAAWRRTESGRLTGVGFCEVPDPELPKLPAAKWWHAMGIIRVRGGDIYRKHKFEIADCPFHERDKP